MDGSVRRFACTHCGKCCNRSPEVELSEAAGLVDVFVFRLMFRLYSLPRSPSADEGAELFYEKKRLLAAHAARKYTKKGRTHYLMISALSLDVTPGACVALNAGRCGIYERRPLGCRTVPFHYARAERLAERDFDAFVSTPGFACDVGDGAPIVLRDGRIADAGTLQSRAMALAAAESDRPWKEIIIRRMHGNASLPTVSEVEANAGFAAMTTSMRVAWQIAVDAGLMRPPECEALVAAQLATIEKALTRGAAESDQATLQEMAFEYRQSPSLS